ncbi:hypothetical protein [Methanolobus vulcani]|uniref:CARDB domain-containing protein n=1 Tax=Methanolobus vulcani TaxID=38026 RepID=A0A7Z8KQE3_9EURY|nr:hypothetical protein [Methanolobus vulcani]TQD27919.1 hypothetical protein FKV42_02335 [Methanolobus vulcani]
MESNQKNCESTTKTLIIGIIIGVSVIFIAKAIAGFFAPHPDLLFTSSTQEISPDTYDITVYLKNKGDGIAQHVYFEIHTNGYITNVSEYGSADVTILGGNGNYAEVFIKNLNPEEKTSITLIVEGSDNVEITDITTDTNNYDVIPSTKIEFKDS